MKYIKWTFWFLIFLVVFGFFHYTLPQRDIVRVTDVEPIRMDFSRWNRIFYAQADSGAAERSNRDVRLISTSYPDGDIMVFRNEDTGFGWPPYFKLDSSNLNAEATDIVSTRSSPEWVAITHYGWRNEILSIYPNAVAIKKVDGPNVTLIPWFNIFFYILLGLLCLGAFRLVQRFKRRRIDPVLEDVSEAWDNVEEKASDMRDSASGAGDKAKGVFKKWFG